MSKKWIAFGIFALCSVTAQAAKITSLKIENNTVIVSQDGNKAAGSPACAAGQPTKWVLPLMTDSDRATYAALVAAAGSNMDIVVTTAGRCLESTGIEQMKSLEVIPVIVATGGQGMKVVAIGQKYSSTSVNVAYTAKAANGASYMIVKERSSSLSLQCMESSQIFEVIGPSVTSVLCYVP